MKDFNIAILGCGTVGGGVARIITDLNEELTAKTGKNIKIKKIVELDPKSAIEKFNISADLFSGGGKQLNHEESEKYILEIINDNEIDIVIETIGGTSDFVYHLAIDILKSKKHLVTANKALLAERGKEIFRAAQENGKTIGFEAAVCGAIPIIKTIKESFTGDEIISISGIMNGTSNYILSKMKHDGISFKEALKLAQELGYAEADPTLDINGGDAAHKLIILAKLIFGIDIGMEQLQMKGIEKITYEDIDYANEIDCTIKLICYAKKIDGNVYATVCPMMVKNNNLLADVNGATNALRITNKYSGRHLLMGAGAGSFETASSIVADIVFAAKFAEVSSNIPKYTNYQFIDTNSFEFPYLMMFETEDVPGITGLVTTEIGNENINIDTVSHNRHRNSNIASFSIATTPCTKIQIDAVIDRIKKSKPNVLLSQPKIIPILY